MNDLEITSCLITDYPALIKLFKRNYNILQLVCILNKVRSKLLTSYVVRKNNNIIGFISFSIYNNKDIILSNLLIDKEYRNKGIGTVLLNKTKYKMLFEYGAKDIYLIAPNNTKSLHFFNNNEFIKCKNNSIIDVLFNTVMLKFVENTEFIKLK